MNKKLVLFSVMLSVLPTLICGFFPVAPLMCPGRKAAIQAMADSIRSNTAQEVARLAREATTALNTSGSMAAHIIETLTAQQARTLSFIENGIRLAREAAAQVATAGIRANTAQEVARLAREAAIEKFRQLYAAATAATLTGIAYVDSLVGSSVEDVAKQTVAATSSTATTSTATLVVGAGSVPVSSSFLQGMVDGIAQHKLMALGIATVVAGTAYCAYYKIHPLTKLKKAFKRS